MKICSRYKVQAWVRYSFTIVVGHVFNRMGNDKNTKKGCFVGIFTGLKNYIAK